MSRTELLVALAKSSSTVSDSSWTLGCLDAVGEVRVTSGAPLMRRALGRISSAVVVFPEVGLALIFFGSLV